MAITEDRIVAIEGAITEIQENMKNLISRLQFNQYILNNDQEIAEIKNRLDSVETQIQVLQGS